MADSFLFLAGRRWLDFVNTQIAQDGERVDLLEDFAGLTRWLEAAGVVQWSEAEAARARWGSGADGERALDAARQFRTTLRAMAAHVVDGATVPAGVVADVNALLRRRHGFTQLVNRGETFAAEYRAEFAEPEDLLTPIADDVADFLCRADLSRLRRCENAACVLFFYDTSKSHGRRWCSMSGCGNRMKAAAHYRRVREKRPSGECLSE